jgi:hypothetical protein
MGFRDTCFASKDTDNEVVEYKRPDGSALENLDARRFYL